MSKNEKMNKILVRIKQNSHSQESIYSGMLGYVSPLWVLGEITRVKLIPADAKKIIEYNKKFSHGWSREPNISTSNIEKVKFTKTIKNE